MFQQGLASKRYRLRDLKLAEGKSVSGNLEKIRSKKIIINHG